MLAVADGEGALAGFVADDEFEAGDGGIDGDEGAAAVVVFAGGDGAFPLAEIEYGLGGAGFYVDVAEFLAAIFFGEFGDLIGSGGDHEALAFLGEFGLVARGRRLQFLLGLGLAVEQDFQEAAPG